MEEIWKDIKNYEGYYQVSSLGRIRSLDRYVLCRNGQLQLKKGIIFSLCYNKRVDIYEVHLNKECKRKCFKVHRLVAEAFIHNDDPINKTTVNHKDGDRSNNQMDNLEWATYSENEKHSYDELDRPINIPKKSKRQTTVIDKNNDIRTIWESIAAASRASGLSETQIRRIAAGECVNDKYDFIIEPLN